MAVSEVVETGSKTEKQPKEKKAPRNIYLKSVNRAMLENRYSEEGEFAENNDDGFSVRYNEQYVYEKFKREFITSLEIKSKEELDEFINKAWLYIGKEGERQKAKKVDDIIEQVLDDPEALTILKRRLEKLSNVKTSLVEANKTNGDGQKTQKEEVLPM